MDGTGLLAGASNACLTEPGQNTAISLAFTSIVLVRDCVNVETVITMKILLQLRNEIHRAFAKAGQKLQGDHVRYST
jgi:hypothetical protein